MKKILLIVLALPSFAFADASVFDQGSWYIDHTPLSTHRHEPVSFNGHVYNYSLNYLTPDHQQFSSDMCEQTSPTTLSCVYNQSIVADIKAHSVTLNNSLTYYERGYSPPNSPLSGTWSRQSGLSGEICQFASVYKIVIPSSPLDATQFRQITIYEEGGFSTQTTWNLVKDTATGHLKLRNQYASTGGYDLYDNNNNFIYDVDQISHLVKLNDSRTKYDERCDLKITTTTQ